VCQNSIKLNELVPDAVQSNSFFLALQATTKLDLRDNEYQRCLFERRQIKVYFLPPQYKRPFLSVLTKFYWQSPRTTIKILSKKHSNTRFYVSKKDKNGLSKRLPTLIKKVKPT
jgi:hypothetical protein